MGRIEMKVRYNGRMVAPVLASLVLFALPLSGQKDMGASWSALPNIQSLRGVAEVTLRIESPEGDPRLPSSSSLRALMESQLREHGVPVAKVSPEYNPLRLQDPSRPTLILRLKALRTLTGTYALDVDLRLASRTTLPGADRLPSAELVRWNHSILALVEKDSMSYGVRVYVDQLLREFGDEYRGSNPPQSPSARPR
jgi:hypothetical protein